MTSRKRKTINLALQGGGSHGAFTWGVLDRLLSDDRIVIEGVSGTSSGAINAAVMAYGLAKGGHDGARETLKTFWKRIGEEFSEIFKTPIDHVMGGVFNSSNQPALDAYLALISTFSPYHLNSLDMNPLRSLVEESVDFEFLKKNLTVKLFVSATNVKTGKLRVFENKEVTIDALMASACLPSIHRAVEIDGESYWDGGFSGNPPVFPLIFNCKSNDIVIVMLHPLEIQETPISADEIRTRASELSFNSAFLREMRAIAFSKELINKDWMPSGKLESKVKNINIHLIENQALFLQYESSSRYSTLPSLMEELHREGYACAEVWLESKFDKLGKESTVNLKELFC